MPTEPLPSSSSQERPRPRGRPPSAESEKVSSRIISAATTIFLERGFERTTLDLIADVAHVGKTTLYSRFSDKQTLFKAVLQQYADDLHKRMAQIDVTGDRQERLRQAGVQLARLTLTPDSIGLMRFALAETANYPEIGRQGMTIGFGGCVQSIIACLSDRADNPDETVMHLATRFVELALHPLYFHAFAGADLGSLLDRAIKDVDEVARMLGVCCG